MRSSIEGRAWLLAVVVAVAIPARSPAQQAGGTQRAIPIRQVVTLAATDSGSLVYPSSIRPLSDGRILVNEGRHRQLLLFDTTMRAPTIVADTAPGARNLYSTRSGGGHEIAQYRGDSSLLLDAGARGLAGSMIVVDPNGNFGRVIAIGSMQQGAYLTRTARGSGWMVDARGRLTYSGPISRPPTPRPTGDTVLTLTPDSAAVVRIDLDAFGKPDTIAKYGVTSFGRRQVFSQGRSVTTNIVNPLPDADEWTMLPDGTVAIIRSHDYHIDWYLPDGTKRSTPKMPFDWRPVSTEEKQKLIDSARAAQSAELQSRIESAVSEAAAQSLAARPQFDFVKPDEMRDYYPPVRPGQVFADWNGNVWTLPSTSASASGGLLYDVINRDGTIVERVQLPMGQRIAAFGKGDIVYTMVGTPDPRPNAVPTARIERARIVR